jgi:hypothetical protein
MLTAVTSMARPAGKVRSSQMLWGVVCFLVLASNVWSMSHWNEARGVYDNICYLRQAHLFQRFGLGGLDTDISKDDDHYLASKLKEIGFPTWNDPTTAPCHTPMPASGRRVLQYPPGTGLLLAVFPQGHQVVPLYIAASVILFGFALLAIFAARTASSVVLAGAVGCLAIYLMINPSKASYSMAPTMPACAIAGYLTARWLMGTPGRRLLTAIMLGLVLGTVGRFQAAEPVPVVRLYSVSIGRVPVVADIAGLHARPLVRRGIPGRSGADAAVERDQRRQPVCDDLWLPGRDASRFLLWHHQAVCDGPAIRPAAARGRVDGADPSHASRERYPAGRFGRGRKSPGESCLLHEPSGLHALLYDPDRDAFAVDVAVRIPDAAFGSSGP